MQVVDAVVNALHRLWMADRGLETEGRQSKRATVAAYRVQLHMCRFATNLDPGFREQHTTLGHQSQLDR